MTDLSLDITRLAQPQFPGDALLEASPTLAPSWTVTTNLPVSAGDMVNVTVPAGGDTMFYRLRQL